MSRRKQSKPAQHRSDEEEEDDDLPLSKLKKTAETGGDGEAQEKMERTETKETPKIPIDEGKMLRSRKRLSDSPLRETPATSRQTLKKLRQRLEAKAAAEREQNTANGNGSSDEGEPNSSEPGPAELTNENTPSSCHMSTLEPAKRQLFQRELKLDGVDPEGSLDSESVDEALGSRRLDRGDSDSRDGSMSPYTDDFIEVKTSTGIRRICKHCGKECIKPSDLKRHLMVHTGEKPFKCEICGKGFKAKGSMLYHMKAHHDINIELSQGLEERYLRLQASKEHKKLRLLMLTGSMAQGVPLDGSTDSDGNTMNETPISDTEANTSQDLPDTDAFIDCNSNQTSTLSDVDHQRKREKIDNLAGLLNARHDLTADSNKNTETVIECDGHFPGTKEEVLVKQETVLVTQIQGIKQATGEPVSLFRCDICEQVFKQLKNISAHIASHFERHLAYYECKHCSACFKFKTLLLQHAWRCHNIKLSKTRKSSTLRDYMNSTIEICSKEDDPTLVADENQNELKTVNSDEGAPDEEDAAEIKSEIVPPKPSTSRNTSAFPGANTTVTKIKTRHGIYFKVNGAFVCRWCSRSFLRLFCLQRHERIHTGFKPCYCKECGKGFSESRNLRLHIMRFHANSSQVDVLNNVRRNRLDAIFRCPPAESKIESLSNPPDDTTSTKINNVPDAKTATQYSPINPAASLANEIRERENLDDDVMVVIPSDAPLVEDQATSKSTKDDSKQTSEEDNEKELDKSLSTDEASIGTAPVKCLAPKTCLKSKRKPVQPTRLHSFNEDENAKDASIATEIEGTNQTEHLNEATDDESDKMDQDSKPKTTDEHKSKITSIADQPPSVPIVKMEHTGREGDSPLTSRTQELEAAHPTLAVGLPMMPPPLHLTAHSMYYANPLLSPVGAVIPYGQPMISIPPNYPCLPPLSPQTSACKMTSVNHSITSTTSAAASTSPISTSPDPAFSNADDSTGINMVHVDPRRLDSPQNHRNSSLSRTHSRYSAKLHVVSKPVKREDACKPMLLPDGRTVYRCTYCFKDFGSYSDINRHMDFHEDIRPYKCNFCDYYARTNSQLKVHMMRHQGIREFHCRLCNYKGVTQSDLNRHMKSQIHMLKAQNECRQCGEGFVSQQNLRIHWLTCQGPKSEEERGDLTPKNGKECQHCGESFRSEQKLRLHWLSCHGSGADNGEKAL